MLGAGGQSAWIVRSHDLVIVRIGKYRGEAAGEAARRRGTARLMQLVPPSKGAESHRARSPIEREVP